MFCNALVLLGMGLKWRTGIGHESSITSGSIRHCLSAFHLAPSSDKPVIKAPSFTTSVMSETGFYVGIKSNSSLSIDYEPAFLLYFCKREVVKPVG